MFFRQGQQDSQFILCWFALQRQTVNDADLTSQIGRFGRRALRQAPDDGVHGLRHGARRGGLEEGGGARRGHAFILWQPAPRE